jgi:hypothetical protein
MRIFFFFLSRDCDTVSVEFFFLSLLCPVSVIAMTRTGTAVSCVAGFGVISPCLARDCTVIFPV